MTSDAPKKKYTRLVTREERAKKRQAAPAQTRKAAKKIEEEDEFADLGKFMDEIHERQADARDGAIKSEAIERAHSGGGLLTGMRGGFKSVVGQDEESAKKKKKSSFWDVLSWLIIIAAFGYFIYKRFIQ